MSSGKPQMSGRILRAPQGNVAPAVLEEEGRARRSSMGRALAMGAGAVGAGAGHAATAVVDGDPAILTLPPHSRGLGQPVAATGYGSPSAWEKNIKRRPSPGLTQVPQASVSFCPLQSLFGIITPTGLHFERHHQGWWGIDPPPPGTA